MSSHGHVQSSYHGQFRGTKTVTFGLKLSTVTCSPLWDTHHRIENKATWLSAKAADRKDNLYLAGGDFFPQHESLFRRSTVHMASSGIRMCLSLWILRVMTKKMPGITKGTYHRNWLKCSQVVNHKAKLYSWKEKVKGNRAPCGPSHPSIKAVLIQATARPEKKNSQTRKERELVPHARQGLHTQANTTQLLGDS